MCCIALYHLGTCLTCTSIAGGCVFQSFSDTVGDWQCKSDRCLNKVCVPKHKLGEKCSGADEHCKSNVCARMDSDNNQKCCAHKYSRIGYDYCGNLNNGEQCKYDNQCKVKRCTGNRCTPKLQNGQRCKGADEDCESNVCARL